jgi:hypothetical protein
MTVLRMHATTPIVGTRFERGTMRKRWKECSVYVVFGDPSNDALESPPRRRGSAMVQKPPEGSHNNTSCVMDNVSRHEIDTSNEARSLRQEAFISGSCNSVTSESVCFVLSCIEFRENLSLRGGNPEQLRKVIHVHPPMSMYSQDVQWSRA